MTSTKKDPVIVVLQLTGGNDYFNTVVPYNEGLYYDNRPAVHYEQDQIIKVNDELGFMPTMGPIKELYDQGKVAVIHGIGYADSPRSHFRSMDIWHTCEPDKVGTEGWAGRVARELDPNKENVLTAINFGHGLPRALVVPGVPVAAIADLSTYGVLTGISDQEQRARQEAKEEIANIRARLVDKYGEERTVRMAEKSRNLLIFPNLIINDTTSITVRLFWPTAPDHMEVTAWEMATGEESGHLLARRLDNFLTFLGPGGFATPDDTEALESCQAGFRAQELEWSDISRGMKRPAQGKDELQIRAFWRMWYSLVAGLPYQPQKEEGEELAGRADPVAQPRSSR